MAVKRTITCDRCGRVEPEEDPTSTWVVVERYTEGVCGDGWEVLTHRIDGTGGAAHFDSATCLAAWAIGIATAADASTPSEGDLTWPG